MRRLIVVLLLFGCAVILMDAFANGGDMLKGWARAISSAGQDVRHSVDMMPGQ